MTYFSELSRYRYAGSEWSRNVGWLDAKHEFQTGATSEEFRHKLREYCFHTVMATRGLHQCEICKEEVGPITISCEGSDLTLGGAEIRVRGRWGRVYAAPDLIAHYVEAHDYLPPDEFVDAVLSGRPDWWKFGVRGMLNAVTRKWRSG